MPKHQNRPGGPANLPEHSADGAGGAPPAQPNKHAQTSRGTGGKAVADPHPSNEEHYDRIRHPGGAHPPKKDLSTAVSRHDGEPPPRPRNADNE